MDFRRCLPLSLVVAAISCSGEGKSGSAFAGKSKKLTVKESPRNPVGEGLPSALDPTATGFNLSSPVRTSVNGKEVWAVAYTDGNSPVRVYRIGVDDENAVPAYPTTVWTAPFNAGFRTYVTEMGLIFGTSKLGYGPPAIWWASDQNPGEAQMIHHVADAIQDSRTCVTSWRDASGQVWVGGAYTADNGGAPLRRFVRKPVLKDPTTGAFSFGAADVRDYGEGWWGYTCYTDQAHGRFWATFIGSHPMRGIHLADMSALDASQAPNANHRNDVQDYLQDPTVSGSYSMNGDEQGNLLNAGARPGSGLANHQASYAWAYDPVSKFILGSTWAGDKFYVTHPACFSSLASCPVNDKHFVHTGMAALGTIGPLSSLNDGRVAAWSRSSHHSPADGYSFLYFISLNDTADPKKGLKIKKIKEVPGETYMYTDFTGATLYPADVQKTIDLSQGVGFRPGIPITRLVAQWSAQSGQAEEWRGLKMKSRCFAKGAKSIPDFVDVTVPAAGTQMEFPACSGGVDTLEIKIFASGDSSGFSRTKSIEITGAQKASGE